jgi:hypothetical protein
MKTMLRPADSIAQIILATEDGRLKWQYIGDRMMQSSYNGGNFRIGWNGNRGLYVFTIKEIPAGDGKPAIRNLNISENLAPNVRELFDKATDVADQQEKVVAEICKLFDVETPVEKSPGVLNRVQNWFRGLL